jgi:hypothetical protein
MAVSDSNPQWVKICTPVHNIMRKRPGMVVFTTAMALFLVGFLAAPVRADAIDGDWCHGTSHFTIDGSTIVTPWRNRVQGRYSRYSFDYVVPANEPGAGSEVTMMMIRGQEQVHLNRSSQVGGAEIWTRCKPVS